MDSNKNRTKAFKNYAIIHRGILAISFMMGKRVQYQGRLTDFGFVFQIKYAECHHATSQSRN
jgi:hypothetical protein